MTGLQTDAATAVLEHLQPRVVGAPVRSSLPHGWSVADGPAVTVTSDGTPVTDRLATREMVRVNVYAEHQPVARDTAAAIDAALLARGAIRGLLIRPGPGLIVTYDDKMQAFIASVTVSVSDTRH